MRIVLLSRIDYAGSAHKLFCALKRHTDFTLDLFSGNPENRFYHPTNIIVTKENKSNIQAILDQADIVHFKGDWPPVRDYLNLNIPNKPVVMTTSGSFFRKKEHKGIGLYSNKDYNQIPVTLKTSFEPDLLYPEYSDIWTPHPIDSDEQPVLWKQNGKPIFMHIPSTPGRKGTGFVQKVFDILKSKIDCDTYIKTGITFKEAVAMKKKATIYFDQFEVGFYGNSALEAMQWGIPVVCWLSPWAISQANGQLEGCPIINEDKSNPEKTANRIISLLEDKDLSRKTKAWCDAKHGYKAIANQWKELYERIQ